MTSLLDPTVLRQGWGPWAPLAIAAIVFIESGCLVLARCVPVVRPYVPVTVGTVRFPCRRFAGWNALEGLAWAGIMAIAGSLLGHIAFITNHIDLIAIGIVLVSLVPIVISLSKPHRQARN